VPIIIASVASLVVAVGLAFALIPDASKGQASMEAAVNIFLIQEKSNGEKTNEIDWNRLPGHLCRVPVYWV
jgi:hypothetical protein